MVHDVMFNPSDGKDLTQRPPADPPPIDRRYRDAVNICNLRPRAALSTGCRIDNRGNPARRLTRSLPRWCFHPPNCRGKIPVTYPHRIIKIGYCDAVRLAKSLARRVSLPRIWIGYRYALPQVPVTFFESRRDGAGLADTHPERSSVIFLCGHAGADNSRLIILKPVLKFKFQCRPPSSALILPEGYPGPLFCLICG